jgi:hypothetical protein
MFSRCLTSRTISDLVSLDGTGAPRHLSLSYDARLSCKASASRNRVALAGHLPA